MNWIPKITYIESGTVIERTVQFDFPPEDDPLNEEYVGDVKTTTSNNGRRQFQWNFTKQLISVKFRLQSQVLKNNFEFFFVNHGVKGGEFKYFPSSDETAFETYTLDGSSVSFDRIIPSNIQGEFFYDLGFKMSRIF